MIDGKGRSALAQTISETISFGDPTGRSADPEEAATARPVRPGKNADDGRRARSIELF